ncbi:MAG TPA: TlpA disulfide reductase family protein [Verrucomicrobiae bacterium]|jgi:thiol-disulfide isomerase/thioredoxin
MKTLNRCFLAVALVLIAGFSLNLSAATLNVGDPAPKLQTGRFVQGAPINAFTPGTAYIVEFWATWCGPCKASIPHLNETYKKFKDQGLVVIGQDCWEQDESKVAPFVKSMGEQMTYRVALDDKNGSQKGKMAETWMDAADRKGIPSAFLVDTHGNIAWIGHPMELKPSTIAAVLAGTYKAKETAAAEEKAKVQVTTLKNDITLAVRAKEWDKAATGLDELAALAGDDDALNNYIYMTRFSVLVGKKDFPAAFKVARQLSEATKDKAIYQNIVSLLLTTDDAIKHPDLDLAQTVSLRAVDLAKDPVEKGLYLDTLARVQFMRGSTNDAIASEQRAVDLATNNPSIKEKLQMGLDSYQQGELPAPTWKRTKPASK